MTRRIDADVYEGLVDSANDLRFWVDGLRGDPPGSTDYQRRHALLERRYFREWSSHAGKTSPQILFFGSEKQGKSTLLMGLMFHLLEDRSFEFLQHLRREGFQNARLANSDFGDPSVVRVKSVDDNSSFLSFEELRDGDGGWTTPFSKRAIIELLPREPLLRLLRAALLAEATITTAWQAYFFLDETYRGQERVEIDVRGREEIRQYIEASKDSELIGSETQRAKDRKLLEEFRKHEFPDQPWTVKVDRTTDLAGIHPFLRLLVLHKHLVREIRWYSATPQRFSGLSGLTLVDSPGYRGPGDGNSEVTAAALDSKLFFNWIVRAERTEQPLMELIGERLSTQPDLLPGLAEGRFLLTLTMCEAFIEQGESLKVEDSLSTAETLRRQLQSHANELRGLLGLGLTEDRRPVPALSFITGAKQDKIVADGAGWLDWKLSDHPAVFDDVEPWSTEPDGTIPGLHRVDLARAAEAFGTGDSCRHLAETLHRNGPWFHRAYQRQVHSDLEHYRQAVRSLLSSIQPDPEKSLGNCWQEIVVASRKLEQDLLRGNLDVTAPEFVEPEGTDRRLAEVRQTVRSGFEQLSFVLHHGETQIDILDLYCRFAPRDPITSRKGLADLLTSRFHGLCVRWWLSRGAPPQEYDVIYAQTWEDLVPVVTAHIRRSLLESFRMIQAMHQDWETGEPPAAEPRLLKLLASSDLLAFSSSATAVDWVTETYALLDGIRISADEKHNRNVVAPKLEEALTKFERWSAAFRDDGAGAGDGVAPTEDLTTEQKRVLLRQLQKELAEAEAQQPQAETAGDGD